MPGRRPKNEHPDLRLVPGTAGAPSAPSVHEDPAGTSPRANHTGPGADHASKSVLLDFVMAPNL